MESLASSHRSMIDRLENAKVFEKLGDALMEDGAVHRVFSSMCGVIFFTLLALIIVLCLPVNNNADVHIVPGLLTKGQTALIVREAELAAAQRNPPGWTRFRHKSYPTTDLPAKEITTLGEFWNTTLPEKVFPALAQAFQVPMESLSFQDLFVVKYSMDGQRGLQVHKDGSHLSFNIALSESGEHYEGAGTWLHLLDRTVSLNQGDGMLHPSRVFHKGVELDTGVRYILVGFVVVSPWHHWIHNTWGLWARCMSLHRDGAVLEEGCVARSSHLWYSLWHFVNWMLQGTFTTLVLGLLGLAVAVLCFALWKLCWLASEGDNCLEEVVGTVLGGKMGALAQRMWDQLRRRKSAHLAD